MAAESCTARAIRRVTEAALRLRQPARRYAGSVRSAVEIVAVVVGAYTLVLGSMYCNGWGYYYRSGLVQTSAGFAFITTIMDIALIFGVLIKEDKTLQYIVCASMALYWVCVPLSFCTFLGTAIMGSFEIPLWEIPRMALYLLHLGLMYCLLAELRGDPLPPPPATPPPPAEGVGVGGGWLKNNLARTGPPAPGHAGDEALLKVQVDHPRYNNVPAADLPPGPRPGSGGGGPAVFAPSSCTTAMPVHPAYPPPPAPTAAPAAVSGPPSTSEA